MADSILITCPDCNKQLKGPAELQGKKIRCKSCGHAFVVKGPGAAKEAPSKVNVASKTAAKPSAPVAPPVYHEDADGKNPYKLTDILQSNRCPQCAADMEDGAIICLNCGYNTQTRQRTHTVKTYETTGLDYLIWLTPGILCALVVLIMLGVIAFLWFVLGPKYGEEWYGHFSIRVWGSVIATGIGWITGQYAFKRLVLNFTPPEKIRR